MAADKPGVVIPLSRLRAALARPRGAQRVDALLSADDPQTAVAALPVTELYFLVSEVGFADAGELVALAEPEQLRGCLDLDVWDRDRVQISALMPWLAQVAEAGFEKLGEVWEALDPELGALFLSRNAAIYDRSLGESAPEDEERPVFTTPDSFFDIVLTGDDEEEQKLVFRIVDDLYRADMQLARHTIMSARSELPAELEEMSYRWRSGRLADLGYVDFYDALEVFRPLDPASVEIGEATADILPTGEDQEGRDIRELPVPMLDQVAGRAFLAQALERISDAHEIERLQGALVVLVNKVLAAARVSPGDPEALAIGAEHATATLALGLEHVCGGDLERAVDALASISLTRLHRVGYTMTLRLARLARALAPRADIAGEPSTSVLAALLAPRPFFSRALVGEDGVRPFESRDDLRQVAENLRELALRIALADALEVDVVAAGQAPEPRPELDDYLRTAALRAAVGGALEPAPLTAEELERFAALLEDGEVPEATGARVAAQVVAALDRHEVAEGRGMAPLLVTRWLAELADVYAELEPPIDPRFVGGVITAASKS